MFYEKHFLRDVVYSYTTLGEAPLADTKTSVGSQLKMSIGKQFDKSEVKTLKSGNIT